ncbi:MAG: carbohydrate transporter ATP-binding protein family, partial [Clostridia bacterium]|nr:carbohydrate transporter ATP-binding protein family [Clostridia bacterium]
MDYIIQGFWEAIQLLLSFDKEIFGIILLTLYITIMSTFIATIIAVPLGILTGIKKFRFKKTLIRFLYTFM